MTDDPTYSPFPEAELEALATFHDSVALTFAERSYLRDVHETRARTCRNALLSFAALRDRFLEQSMTVRALQAEKAA